MSRYNERGERLGTFVLYTYKPDGTPRPNPPIYPTREEAERQGEEYLRRNPDSPKSRSAVSFGKRYYVRDALEGVRRRSEERVGVRAG